MLDKVGISSPWLGVLLSSSLVAACSSDKVIPTTEAVTKKDRASAPLASSFGKFTVRP